MLAKKAKEKKEGDGWGQRETERALVWMRRRLALLSAEFLCIPFGLHSLS